MNCIIIEDEPAAQSILESHISKCPDLRCCGTFGDAFSAQTFLSSNPIDLIFLDINLPEMSGCELFAFAGSSATGHFYHCLFSICC